MKHHIKKTFTEYRPVYSKKEVMEMQETIDNLNRSVISCLVIGCLPLIIIFLALVIYILITKI
jgi:hypothetical protein